MSEKLFGEFKKSTDQEWLDRISKDLKGRSAGDISKSRPYEDFRLKAFYTSSENNAHLNLNLNQDWKIITDAEYLESTISDPIEYLVSTGNWIQSEKLDMEIFVSLYKEKEEGKNIGVNGEIYQSAGASASFELACILSHVNEYFNLLRHENCLNKDILKELSIKVSIGNDYFLEIAKIRALRILIENLAQAYDLNSAISFQLYAQNSIMCFSSSDHDTNILRSTTACMAAVIGGCDHLHIKAHNLLSHESDAFGDRIARNIQLMMKHEAHLDKVIDASSGSYFIDSLTREISEKAWSEFKFIELKGGLITAFKDGYIQHHLRKTADLRIKHFREGQDVFIGINRYQKEKSETRRTFQYSAQVGEYEALKPIILEDVVK